MDSRVEEIVVTIHLKPGWRDQYHNHVIRAKSVRDAKAELDLVRPCYCTQCQEDR